MRRDDDIRPEYDFTTAVRGKYYQRYRQGAEIVALFHPVEVKALSDYKIWVRFADGVEGEVDLSHLAGRGVFSSWQDYRVFQQVHIGPGGEIAWSEEMELCPDSIYLKLTGRTPNLMHP